MIRNQNQSGFAHMVAVLVVVVVVAIGGVGYYVYQKQSADDAAELKTTQDIDDIEGELEKQGEDLDQELQAETEKLDSSTTEVQ